MIWEDTVTLDDGVRIHVRVVRPSDRPTFRAGWERLSEPSRLFRFHQPRSELTPAEIDYLTDVDGVDHYALGAVTRDDEGVEGPVAVARFVRMDERPDAADFAITVVDEFQSRGVGELMLRRILDAARKRGYRALIADILLENTVARHLVESVAPRAKHALRGDLVRYEIPLDDEAEADEAPEEASA